MIESFPGRFPDRASLFAPSAADKALAGAWALKVELLKVEGDDDSPDEISCSYEIKGQADGCKGISLLADLVAAFSAPRKGGGS